MVLGKMLDISQIHTMITHGRCGKDDVALLKEAGVRVLGLEPGTYDSEILEDAT